MMGKVSDMAMDQQQEGVDELLCEIDHLKSSLAEARQIIDRVYTAMGSTMPGAAKAYAFLDRSKS